MTKREWRRRFIQYGKALCGGIRGSYIRWEAKMLCDSMYTENDTIGDVQKRVEEVFSKIREGDDRGYCR